MNAKAVYQVQNPTTAVEATPEANLYHSGSLSHTLAYVNGLPVAACTGKATKKGKAIYRAGGFPSCNRCSGAHR